MKSVRESQSFTAVARLLVHADQALNHTWDWNVDHMGKNEDFDEVIAGACGTLAMLRAGFDLEDMAGDIVDLSVLDEVEERPGLQTGYALMTLAMDIIDADIAEHVEDDYCPACTVLLGISSTLNSTLACIHSTVSLSKAGSMKRLGQAWKLLERKPMYARKSWELVAG